MKKSARGSLIAVGVAALGVGIGVGWLLRGDRQDVAARPTGRIVKALSAASAVPAEGQAVADRGEHAAVVVAEEQQRMKTMSAQEFAVHLVGLHDERTQNTSPDKNLLYGLYLSHCDSERAMAAMEEFKRRGTKQEQLGRFIAGAGKVDGQRLVQRMLEASTPKTKYQYGLNSAVCGWGAAHPREAVEWLNSVPEGAPYYTAALQGLMWGVAETSPAIALQVFEQLSEQDRYAHTDPGISAADSLGRSTVTNHGLKAFSELLDGISDQAAKEKILGFSLREAMNQPPADFVQHMAGAMDYSPDVRAGYESMAARWVAAAPDAAMKWLSESAQRPGHDAALRIVAAQLANSAGSSSLTAWLAANPGAPGRAAIAAGKSGAPAGGSP